MSSQVEARKVHVSIVSPVLNEVDFIGYSIMSFIDFIHEFVYAIDKKSDDGTRELLYHIKDKYAHEKLKILEHATFHPHEMDKYNGAFNRCISESSGDAVAFFHPDMILNEKQVITNPDLVPGLDSGPLAWTTNITSYAGDFQTQIVKGRAKKWKNIHANKFGLIYRGAYGSQNEDFYHSDITGNAYLHFGEDLLQYPYEIADSGLEINHYCELKGYARRLEKMKLCIKTQYPNFPNDHIAVLASEHPRVTLETSSNKFGDFVFQQTDRPVPEVFTKYKEEFDSFRKEVVNV